MKEKKFEQMNEEEFKAHVLEKAKKEFDFFKEHRGVDAAFSFLADVLYDQAHNRGGYAERRRLRS